MTQAQADWKSFWDLATPEEAAALFRQFYGADAERSAFQCAEAAKYDGRNEDHIFWMSVLEMLGTDGTISPVEQAGRLN